MGSARRKSPTPPAARPPPTIHTPGWRVYNPDEDTDDDVAQSFPTFDTSDSNYTRLHQRRADYERQRWQQWDASVSNPRRKSSKPLKPIFPTPMECGYYLHTALANIARAASKAPSKPPPKTLSTEHALVVEAFSSIEHVFNAQIQRLSQHLASASPNTSQPDTYTVRSPSDKQLPLAPNVDSALRFFMHISAHVGAQSRSMLTQLSHLAKQLDPHFKPNPSALSFSAIHNHFERQNSPSDTARTSSKSPSNRSKNASKPSQPNMSTLAQQIRLLIPERYAMLKASFNIHPAYHLEGNSRTLLQVANSAEHAQHFRPPSRPPSPPPPHLTAKRTRAPASKPARKTKRARQLYPTKNSHRTTSKNSSPSLHNHVAQSPHVKRAKNEATPIPPHLPLNPSSISPTPNPSSPPFRTSPLVSKPQSSSPRHSASTPISASVQTKPQSSSPRHSASAPISASVQTKPQSSSPRHSASAPISASVQPNPPCVAPATGQSPPSSRAPRDQPSGRSAPHAPVVFGLPSDARQKLRENVKRRLTHVKTEEDEYEMRAYEIDEDESVEYVNSCSSPSLNMSNSPSSNDGLNDPKHCDTTQRITFHQVIDVDEPEVVKQPMVVDLDG